MMVWKIFFLFQVCILRFHVNLPGCIIHCPFIIRWPIFHPTLISEFLGMGFDGDEPSPASQWLEEWAVGSNRDMQVKMFTTRD